MKTPPYLLHFDLPCELVSAQLPQKLNYRLATATNVRQYNFGEANLSIQHLNLHPFYVELFELDTPAPFAFRLELTSHQHFLFFMLEGQVRFTTCEGFYISQASKGQMAACHKPAGHYRVSLPAGRHGVCCVAVDAEWLNYATEKLPAFRRYFQENQAHSFLPYIRIDPFLQHRLQQILALKRNGHGRLDGFLRLKFADILEYYTPIADEKQNGPAYKIKAYLSENFTDHQISYTHLAALFDEEERAIRYHFYKEFGISVHRFLMHKRLQRAYRLIMHEGQPMRDVYLLVGYQNESSLRRAYQKFFSTGGKSDT